MPYIKDAERRLIKPGCTFVAEAIASFGKVHPGRVNYAISEILKQLLDYTRISYSEINKLIGALECAKLELYRRLAAPYEDKKIKENGDVYTKD
ncbi:MAG: hypothetical protein JRI45_06760 [Deltaproteobacteria bacterium]|nr:hypothetical protein [Deltaproteobacteria bacterium]